MQSRRAVTFIVLIGVVSLFADVTYEGARSVTGPFLGVLGASALTVSLVSGGGELIGYGLRLWSGWLADRTRRYWAITFTGYAVNLLAVPALAFVGQWQVAAALVVLERAGKAIRTPSRDVMLSYATRSTGHGWGFGLHEALDQIGATAGPLIVAVSIVQGGSYRRGFLVLLVPALAALITLTIAWRLFPRPHDLDPAARSVDPQGLTRAFWVYLGGSCLIAAGYADFPLLAFHFDRTAIVSPGWIPVLYSAAMATDAVAALIFGRWFDRAGLRVMAGAAAISATFAPLAFTNRPALAVLGALVWGIGMGAQESIMRAAVATMTPASRRGTAYGVFNLAFGVAWFAGSAAMGWLYGRSLAAVILFSVTAQLLAIPCFVAAARGLRPEARGLGL